MVFLRDLTVDCTKEPLKVLNVVSKSSFEVILPDFSDYKGQGTVCHIKTPVILNFKPYGFQAYNYDNFTLDHVNSQLFDANMQYSDFEKMQEYSLFDYLMHAKEDLDNDKYYTLLNSIIDKAEDKDMIWQILTKFER